MKTGTLHTSALKLVMIILVPVSFVLPLLMAILNNMVQEFPLFTDILQFFVNALVTFVMAAVQAFFFYIIITLSNRYLPSRLPSSLRIGLEVVCCLLLCFWILYAFFLLLIQPPEKDLAVLNSQQPFRQFLGINILGGLFIYSFLRAIVLYQVAGRNEARTEQLRKQSAQARLQALRDQVNPHFLFNSLSVLSSLVRINIEQSERFIIQLSKAYQYILDQKELEIVSLSEELSFLQSYFFLLQIRFENKINLDTDIRLNPEAVGLPPLTLQILLENVVKHNRMSEEQPLRVRIYNTGDTMVVQNTLNKRSGKEGSTGVGLANIRSRYRMVTNREVVVKEEEETFNVHIPLLQIQAP